VPRQIQKNVISDEMKSMIAAGSRCFCHLRHIFRSRAMSKAVTIKLHTMIVKTFVQSGVEHGL
jgi:hypothetical protein